MKLSELITNVLQKMRSGILRKRSRRVFKVTTYGHGGVLPGVNLDDSSALQDIMEPPEEIRKILMG
jgi:hypothetical protein